MKAFTTIAITALVAGISFITATPGDARPIDWDCGRLGRITTSDFGAPNQIVFITANRIGISAERGVSKGGANWLAIEAPSIHLFQGPEGMLANQNVGSGQFFNGSEVNCQRHQ